LNEVANIQKNGKNISSAPTLNTRYNTTRPGFGRLTEGLSALFGGASFMVFGLLFVYVRS